MNKVSLAASPDFASLSALSKILGMDRDSMFSVDTLYDEFVATREIFAQIVPKADLSTSQKWQEFFRACNEARISSCNMFCIVSAALSIPASNAYCERVFSLMNAKWRKERNRASVELIKSELQIFLNFKHTCSEFYSFALSDKKLLTAAASGQKYAWRRQTQTAGAV